MTHFSCPQAVIFSIIRKSDSFGSDSSGGEYYGDKIQQRLCSGHVTSIETTSARQRTLMGFAHSSGSLGTLDRSPSILNRIAGRYPPPLHLRFQQHLTRNDITKLQKKTGLLTAKQNESRSAQRQTFIITPAHQKL